MTARNFAGLANRGLVGSGLKFASLALTCGILASCAARSDVGSLESRVMKLETQMSSIESSLAAQQSKIDAAKQAADAARRAADAAADSSQRTERMFNKSLKK